MELHANNARATREALEAEVDALRARVAELEKAVRAREECISVTAHDLRTPLTSLKIVVQLLRDAGRQGALAGMPADRLESMLGIAERQTGMLARQIHEMLDLSRMMRGRLKLELAPTDLAAVVRDAVARAESEREAARCPLAVVAPDAVEGRWDGGRLALAVGHLLSNAYRYGAGRPVRVTVEADAREARLAVRDEGLGVAPEDHARIFEPFERADPVPGRKGLGLGLFVARQVFERHGGTLAVESAPGEGATFVATLPRGHASV